MPRIAVGIDVLRAHEGGNHSLPSLAVESETAVQPVEDIKSIVEVGMASNPSLAQHGQQRLDHLFGMNVQLRFDSLFSMNLGLFIHEAASWRSD